MRILVLSRSYPAPGDLYQYPFVHRRVLAYIQAGHEVAVFRLGGEPQGLDFEFEGIRWRSGDEQAWRELMAERQPQVVAVHGFSEAMWPALRTVADDLPICAWLHGSEIPAFFRQKAMCIADPAARTAALRSLAQRCRFWDEFLADVPQRFRFVFVSKSAVELARTDWGERLRPEHCAVVHNPIDTDLFAYREKSADARFAILSIRPFDSVTYANDLTVAAIGYLARRKGFERLQFTLIGDGPLFDETLAPLRGYSNVEIQRRFLSQPEIAATHARNGIFLVPTRLDTQGVSRDEAMASGLVPVTNAVSAVPEFVDEGCAALAAAEDPEGLADALWQMIEAPQLFLRRSAAAARRVRAQSGHERIIPEELALLREAAAS